MVSYCRQRTVAGALAALQLLVFVGINQAIELTQVGSQENPGSSQNETDGRSMDQQQSTTPSQDIHQRARSGRMMDLDHLVGAIGKDEKIARERSINGNRQSRILAEDVIQQLGSASSKTEARSKKSKSGGKKMAIKGFIPIVSVENHKGANPFEDESDEEGEGTEENRPDQLMSGYGGHTSMGHASFVGSASESTNSQQQQPQWTSLGGAGQVDQPEVGRARKLLHGGSPSMSGSILGGLSAGPRRLISTLVPGQQQSSYAGQAQSLQAPMNIPQIHNQLDQQGGGGGGDCICVPFFQCRNGYLSANQLSKSQLQQISASASPIMMVPSMQSTLINQHQVHQIPRALRGANDLYYNGQTTTLNGQQAYESQSGLTLASPLSGPSASQSGEQQVLNDAYEQLKKTMESENIEQLLLQQQQQQQQMINLPLLDERSKSGEQQVDSANSNSSTPIDNTQERSLLNPLAGRRSSQQRSCGIMRICCKIPPAMIGSFNRSPQALRLLQQQHQLEAQQHIPKVQHPYPRPQFMQEQSQVQPQMADFQPTPSALVPSIAHGQLASAATVARPPPFPAGSFMAGRCGTRQALGVAGRVQNVQPVAGSETTAEFGEFPSHAAILKRLSPGDSLFVCSAVLISNQWLATAAHCIKRHRPEELKVRLGEWDVQRDDEFYPFVELNVQEIIVHPDFQPSSLINDLALLRLESSLDPQQMPHIAPACLAAPQEVFARSRCWLTGWGKDAFGQAGSFQSILKKVDLPVMDRQQCESALRYQTKLGKFFRLHQSALCAGGERGKDACEGDGGSGLYCTDPESGLTKVIGLVSWGVGCGQVGVPGVYTNLAMFYPWIESVVSSSGEENLYMDRSNPVGGNSIPDNIFKSLVSERSNQGAHNKTISLPQEPISSNTTTTSSIIDPDDLHSNGGEEIESRTGRR